MVGGLRVVDGDGRPVRISSRKAQALLGCLALEPGAPVSRDVLAALLWEDSDPELARASLRQALAALRKALPEAHVEALCADATSISLDPGRMSSDMARLRAAIRAGADESCVLELSSDDVLVGLDAKSFAFQQWLDQQRSV